MTTATARPRTELKAPTGKYRVVGVDTFEGPCEDYLIGDFDDLRAAIVRAQDEGGVMNPVYVYDDAGSMLLKTGTF